MKMKIVVGSVFVVLLMMLVPSISAVEYNTVVETQKSTFIEKILTSSQLEEIKGTMADNSLDSPFLGFITLLLKWLVTVTFIICPFKIIPLILLVISYIYLLIFWQLGG